MSRQNGKTFEMRLEKWAYTNRYKLKAIDKDKSVVLLERVSDGYPFEVNAHLLYQIMIDEGY